MHFQSGLSPILIMSSDSSSGYTFAFCLLLGQTHACKLMIRITLHLMFGNASLDNLLCYLEGKLKVFASIFVRQFRVVEFIWEEVVQQGTKCKPVCPRRREVLHVDVVLRVACNCALVTDAH